MHITSLRLFMTLAVLAVALFPTRPAEAQTFTAALTNTYERLPYTNSNVLRYYEYVYVTVNAAPGKPFVGPAPINLTWSVNVTLNETYWHYADESLLNPTTSSSVKTPAMVEYQVPNQNTNIVRYYVGRIQQVDFRYSPNREVWARKYNYWVSSITVNGEHVTQAIAGNDVTTSFSISGSWASEAVSPYKELNIWLPWK
jgi:hypothetical protein